MAISSAAAIEVPITIFPLDKYDQDINHWVKPSDSDYNKLLIKLADQKKHLKKYYNHYYATSDKALSPWSSKYVNKILQQKLAEQISEQKIISQYDNINKENPKEIGYAENFRPYSEQWIKNIIANMNLTQFILPIRYNSNNRGIAVKNLYARALPTNDPYFYNFSLPGAGYPFDILQESAVWVGTPVYIIGKTRNQQWYLVLTPNFIAWVESDGIARTNQAFITTWQKHAKQKMVAITKSNISIFDNNNQYRFNAYIGAIFPGKSSNKKTISMLIPRANSYHNAKISIAKISAKNATIMPLKATPHNFANIISNLIGRPYGWGNIYFYNDCSAELQNLYAPFGIWLPRNSSVQTKNNSMVDQSSANLSERLKYLTEHGKKFTTIIYTGGHIMLYLGNYPNPNSTAHELMAMTYQNIWGNSPLDKSYRAIIGQSVLLPMLQIYPEDPKLNSLANRQYFQVSYLNNSDCYDNI